MLYLLDHPSTFIPPIRTTILVTILLLLLHITRPLQLGYRSLDQSLYQLQLQFQQDHTTIVQLDLAGHLLLWIILPGSHLTMTELVVANLGLVLDLQ